MNLKGTKAYFAIEHVAAHFNLVHRLCRVSAVRCFGQLQLGPPQPLQHFWCEAGMFSRIAQEQPLHPRPNPLLTLWILGRVCG